MARTDLALIPLASGAEQWSKMFAMVLAFAFAVAIAFIILFNRWNRADLDTEHAGVILGQLDGFGGSGGGAVVVRSVDALDDVETLRDIRGLFHGERSGEVRVRSATMEIIREVRDELRSRAPPVSKVPVRAAQEGVLTAILGSLAVLPVATWREATKTDGGSLPSTGELLAGASSVVDGVLAALTAFPFTDVLFAFGLTFGILGADTIWTLWFLPPVALLTLAGTYWILERRVDTDRSLTGPPVRVWAVRFLSLAIITWSVGTFPAAIGALIPGPWFVRGLFGVALAFVLMASYVSVASRTRRPDAVTDGGRDREDREDSEDAPEDRLPDVRDDSGADTDVEPRPEPEDGEDTEVSLSDLGESSGEDDHGTFTAFGSSSSPEWGGPEADDDGEDSGGGDNGEDGRSGLAIRASERVRAANWKHTVIFGVLGFAFAHDIAAFLAASVVMASVMAVWARRTLREWTDAAARDGWDAFGLDVVHSVTVTAAALTLPLMVGYGIAAIGTGKVIRVGRAVAVNAPDGTILALGVLAVMVVLTAAVMFLNRFADLRMGLRRALSVQAVRTALFAKALPFALMVVTAILALAVLGTNFVAVIAVTFAVGLIARFAYQVYHYANYRYQSREGRDKSASRVVVNGRKVTDANGDPVYIADVNGHRTAHRRVRPLISQIREDARSLFRAGSAEKGSFSRYYYVNGVKRGKVDMDSVADELLGDVRTRFEANVKKTDASAPDILDKLRSEYPNHVVHEVVKSLKDKGAVTRREDTFVWLGK